jgi:hypothetical protein
MRPLPRRPLAVTLVELVEALAPARAATAGVRVTDLRFELPLEVAIAPDGELLGNVRRWRWPTEFDERPSRLAARFRFFEDEG